MSLKSFYNKFCKADYLNNIDKKNLREKYESLSQFYDDKAYPFKNFGKLGEAQVKLRYVSERKAIQIAWECSRSNRTQKKFPIAIDWIVNLFYIPVKYGFSSKHTRSYSDSAYRFYSHAGFTIMWRNTFESLKEEFDKLFKENEVKHIEIFGWSLGGAMAQFTHEWLRYRYGDDIEITSITIGAPKVFYHNWFNPYFWFTAKSWFVIKERFQGLYMFQNINDIVPKVPFKFLGFSHIMPGIKPEGKITNIFKLFNPQKYHHKEHYDPLVLEYLSK